MGSINYWTTPFSQTESTEFGGGVEGGKWGSLYPQDMQEEYFYGSATNHLELGIWVDCCQRKGAVL